jgi:hypothetical protein
MTHSLAASERLAKTMTATAWAALPMFALIAVGGALEVYPTVVHLTEALGNNGGDVSLAAISSAAFVGVLLGVGITTNLMLRGFAQILLAVGRIEDNHAG